jgi:LmbE family N-acetylglucosaminyl deacetylase
MLNLALHKKSDEPVKLLFLGAHSDDIEIGCGGTVLKLLEQYKRASVYWVVFSADERRAEEARASANMFLGQAESKSVVLKKFMTSFFPYVAMDIKIYFERLKQEVSPDIVFTHYRNDLHQDHRLISELTWNAFRDHLVLEYEIPKYDGDLGSPNSFVHLDKSIVQKKINLIMENFRSQRDKQWFDEETFLAGLRLRGVESNSPGKYAEGFYCRKMVLS